MRILSGEGASIVHNPGSNMRLGVGVAAVREMLTEGLHVGLGTDSRFCSDNLNMFEAIRLASFSSRIHGYDHEKWISPREAFRFGTTGSARTLGFDSTLGRLEPGYKADIVFLDSANTNYIPLVNIMNQIVHAEDATAVRHVMINGDFVYLNRRFPGVELQTVKTEVQEATDRLIAANAEAIANARKLEPIISAHCGSLASRCHPINRFIGKGE
jgi:5-methylthioadenosine/S-adenosylhomocysteine deaminase